MLIVSRSPRLSHLVRKQNDVLEAIYRYLDIESLDQNGIPQAPPEQPRRPHVPAFHDLDDREECIVKASCCYHLLYDEEAEMSFPSSQPCA